MSIACGHCGDSHATVAEVRACAVDHPEAPSLFDGPDGDGSPPPDEPPAPDTERASPSATTGPTTLEVAAVAGDLDVLAGPDALGRGLVVAPGAAAPAPWQDAPRLVVDERTVAGAALAELTGWWTSRERFVVELALALPDRPIQVEDAEPWALGADFTFALDQLAHLVLANSVDLRSGEATFPPRSTALAHGARLSTVADVVLPDGRDAWIDGGPLDVERARGLDLPVVPVLNAERGHLVPLGSEAPRADLAADQLAAVGHRGGPCRVISPAGSGKTRTLTERARHLLREQHLAPGAVGLVAYNVRAADEMRERLADTRGLQIRTLNSLGLAIVTGNGPFATPRSGQRRVGVLDEPDLRRLLDGLVELPRRANTDPMAAWLEALSSVRLGLRPPHEVEADYGGDVDGLTEVFPRFQAELDRRGVVDFDQQIYGAIRLLLTEPEVRRAAQRAGRVLLVDEFQDLTPAHLLLIRLLAAPGFDVFGVGDDDQTIYGYNGADPTWLIDFTGFFPGAGSHPLTVNYRCPPTVVDGARTLLTHNRRRVVKEIRPAPDRTAVEGELVVRPVEATVAATVETVRAHLADGADPGDVAVLTRVNATLAPVQVALGLAGVVTDRVAGPTWLQRTGVRSALAWLRLSTGSFSGPDLAEAARRPPRGLSGKVVEWIGEQRSVDGVARLAGRLSRDRDREKVEAFADDLRAVAERARTGSAREVLVHVRDRLGLEGAMQSLDGSRGRVDRSSHTDDLDALIQLADLHDDPSTFGDWLAAQLRAEPAATDQRVHLSTVHRVKGLEWPHVVVHEVSARLFPHRLAHDVEEERRVFHVALTRCSRTVTVVVPERQPSPFVAQLAEEAAPAPVGAVERPSSPPAPAREVPPLPVAVGLTFDHGGYGHEVVEIGPTGVRTDVGGAVHLDLAFGTRVQADGAWVVLAPPAAAPREDEPGDAGLREALTAWRLARSRADEVPAYVVFTNKTLDDLVARRPRDYAELRACTGIGPAKVEAYGDELLEVIATAG